MRLPLVCSSLLLVLLLPRRSCYGNKTRNLNNSSSGHVYAGGAGYGVYLDCLNRPDVIGLRYYDIPTSTITIEYWYRVLDSSVQLHALMPYSVYTHQNNNNLDGGDGQVVYESPNEFSVKILANTLDINKHTSEWSMPLTVEEEGGGPFHDMEWHHYAFTMDIHQRSLGFYLDGKQLDYGTASVRLSDGDDEIEIRYQTASFGAQWDTRNHPDADAYFGTNTLPIRHFTNPCDYSTNEETEHNNNNNNLSSYVALVDISNNSSSSSNCTHYEQARIAMEQGAWAIVFSNDITTSTTEQLTGSTNETELPQLPIPVLFLVGSTALTNNATNITFLRTRYVIGEPDPMIWKPLKQGGVLTVGQEPDIPWGDFDPQQSAIGILTEVRVWNVVRTPQQIRDHYKVAISVDDPSNDSNNLNTTPTTTHNHDDLNLYWTFDDLATKYPQSIWYNNNNDDDDDNNNNTATIIHKRIETMDLAPNGQKHPGLIGELPTVKNEMMLRGKPPMPPTRPDLIPSTTCPLVGNGIEVVVPVVSGQKVEVELKSFDPDGNNLITTILSLPAMGQLYAHASSSATTTSSTNLSIAAAGQQQLRPLQVGDVIEDYNRTENKRVDFVADSNFDSDTTLEYSVKTDGGGNPVTATVRLIPHRIFQPVSDRITIQENTMTYMVLAKPSQLTQTNMKVVITTLPERGSLYQAQFRPESDQQYEYIATVVDEFGPMERINKTGTIVTNNRGTVLYAPAEFEFSDPSNVTYASFGYQFWDPDAGAYSGIGTKSIIVKSVNDAPVSLASNISLDGPESSSITLVLESSDVDADHEESFATRAFSRITTFPKGGQLYQFDTGAVMDKTVTQVPNTFQWASGVVRFSSQYTQCGESCFSWRNPDCPSADLSGGFPNGTCTQTSWHASQVLGPPDSYPDYGDSRLAWSLGWANRGKEFIELEFPYEMYINAVEIYETFKNGAIWKVSTASEYLDDTTIHCTSPAESNIPECSKNTAWKELWSRPLSMVQPAPEESRIFEPPLCPSVIKSRFLRIDLDSSKVPGWSELDAVKMTGTLDYPPGLVSDKLNRIKYVPDNGIHGIDTLRFATSDCMAEGEEEEFKITLPAPRQGQLGPSFLARMDMQIKAKPNETSQHELDLSPALLRITAVVGQPLSSATATIWYSGALGLVQGTKFENITMDNTTILLNIGVASYERPYPNVEIWIQAPTTTNLTFRVKYEVSLLIECVNGQLDRESGKCLCKSTRWTGTMCEIEVKENRNDVPQYLETIAYCYFVVLASMCIGFFWLVYANRGALIVKVSQPFFLCCLLAGSLITSVAIPVRIQAQSDAACAITYWIFFVGFSVTFGSVLAKIWRTYQVFSSGMRMERKQVTVQQTVSVIAVLVALNVLVLSLWTALDPPAYQRTVLIDDGNGYALSTVGQCKSTTASPYIISCLALNISALLLGQVLCHRARKIPDEFSDTYSVNVSTYTTLNVCVIGIPMLALVKDDPAATLFVECSIMFLVVFAILACTFGNLISWLFFETEDSLKRDIENAVRDMAGSSAPSLAGSSHHSRGSRPSWWISKKGGDRVPSKVLATVDIPSSALPASGVSRLTDNGPTSHGAKDMGAKHASDRLSKLSDSDLSVGSMEEEDAKQESSFAEEVVTRTSLPSVHDQLIPQSDQDRFGTALDALAELEPLLQEHPELLAGSVLCERIDAVKKLTEQISLATS